MWARGLSLPFCVANSAPATRFLAACTCPHLRYNPSVRRRFFVEHFEQNSAVLEGDTAHHLGHVLRAQKDQLYELSDGSSAWLARVDAIARDRIEFTLLEPLPSPKLAVDIALLLAIVKFDAFEAALEKATELGVSQIIPLAAARSEKNLVAAAGKRSERWRKILLESSQQSRRLGVPSLASTVKPATAFSAEAALEQKLCILFSERPDAAPLAEMLQQVRSAQPAEPAGATPPGKLVAIAIGPEGGWTDEELAAARSSGFREASLGPLILRVETAVVSALAVLNFALTASAID
jgi:16S rRNA (uracil1498-N3)-methyltransferase